MKFEVNLSTVASSILIALCLWLGSTVYSLDKKVTLLEYQLQQLNPALQMLAEEKKDK
jgi:hypothetical protein